jgi:hypothetical protein
MSSILTAVKSVPFNANIRLTYQLKFWLFPLYYSFTDQINKSVMTMTMIMLRITNSQSSFDSQNAAKNLPYLT